MTFILFSNGKYGMENEMKYNQHLTCEIPLIKKCKR